MKKIISTFLIVIMLISSLSMTFAAEQQFKPITIIVNGQTVYFPDAIPFIDENNRTMVPIRFISEALGANVTWNGEMKLVMIGNSSTRIALFIGQSQATINTPDGGDIVKSFDTKAVLRQDRTFVPLRFVSETMGANVSWDSNTYTVSIQTDNQEIKVPESIKGGLTAEQLTRLKQIPYSIGSNGSIDGRTGILTDFSKTSEEFIAEYGEEKAQLALETAKGYLEARHNLDYRKLGDEFKEKIKPFMNPSYYDMDITRLIKWITDNKEVIIGGKFYSDPSLIYIDKSGRLRVRGTLRYYVASSVDVEKGFGKGVVLNKWIEEDLEVFISPKTAGTFTGWCYREVKTIATPRIIEGE